MYSVSSFHSAKSTIAPNLRQFVCLIKDCNETEV